MVTYGFYDSKNHDRRYNAIQFGSIFDGIIEDGIFQTIGNCFRVIPTDDMTILVDTGRAWFNHTWTYNDALLPLTISKSDILLDRIDAVVLDIDGSTNVRKNDIIIVKGIPSTNPTYPTLINSQKRHQYPLAYIYVSAGSVVITNNDITHMIGSKYTPYAKGIIEKTIMDLIINLQTRVNTLEKFMSDLKKEQSIYETIYDSSNELILDNSDNSIEGKIVFELK